MWGYEPRFGYQPPLIDPRMGINAAGYDPTFAYQTPLHDPRFGIPGPGFEPRFGYQPSLLDPRLGIPLPGFDPRLGSQMPMVEPRLPWGPLQAATGGFPFPALGFGTGMMALGMLESLEHPAAALLRHRAVGWPRLMSQLGSGALPTDEEIEETIHNVLDLDPFIPLDAEIEIKCDGGQVTLSGTVPDKRIKRAAGEDAWWIPGVTDVNNTITVSGRRQAQASRRRRGQQPAQSR
jgi:hypothetical protein